MVLDTTICRVIKRVDGRRLCLAFKAVDDNRATLTITDEAIAAVFEASMSLHDMVSLMAYQLPLEAYQEHFGKQEHIDAHVKTIVQDMVRTEVGEGEVGVPVLEASTTLANLGSKAKAALDNLPYAPLLDNHSNVITNREGSVVGGGSILAATIDSAEIGAIRDQYEGLCHESEQDEDVAGSVVRGVEAGGRGQFACWLCLLHREVSVGAYRYSYSPHAAAETQRQPSLRLLAQTLSYPTQIRTKTCQRETGPSSPSK